MQLINQNGKIHLRFYSTHKLITRSLGLVYNEPNLAYATQTLLPIFRKIALTNTAQMPQKQPTSLNFATTNTKPKIQMTKIPRNPYLLSHFCAIYLGSLRTYAKLTTLKTATCAINRLFDFLPDLPIRTYAPSDIYNAISVMKNTNLSAQTINLLLSYAKIAFKLAKNHGAISKSPFEFIKKLPTTPKSKFCFTKTQINALLSHSHGELRTFLYIAFFTGARSGEILALHTSDFDFKHDKISICKNQTRFELTTPKNGKSRTINLLKPLKEHILGLNLPNGAIFSSDYFAIHYKFKKLLKSLDLPLCGLHSTRHSFCSHLLGAKVPAPLIASTLGHANLDMINRIYGHFLENKSDLRNLNRAMRL
ncbi:MULTISPECIES: tyrosine-type recombinase/integrase [unclassified Campylobacter]|uniref:tyrosine-type recombinase/integrase n=1 Tax=unclassified Campylobacter TaxID=2593542 RepID=UPI0022E9C7E9|nr:MULTISPECIES: site-specific integrase [unclassified Campylobacter]MDA3061885.1 site-specific integrase [Campylobacter sp. JMF_14 EL1]MDA3073009.1 site-specific integrase [Campylobacter sp. JMF_10 EL2]